MIGRYAAGWFLLMVLAIMNGAFREAFMTPSLGYERAHQVSTVTLIILIAVLVFILTRFWRLGSTRDAWVVGFLWLAMTLVFEFGFGHFVQGIAWSELLKEYNIFAGRLWVLVPAWVTVAPYVFFRLQRNR